jgi:hypothetical protein
VELAPRQFLRDVRVPEPTRGLSIRGRVVDRAGEPVKGCRILARSADRLRRAETDAAGRFELIDLGGEPCDLEAESDGGFASATAFLPGRDDVEMRLVAWGRIEGRLAGVDDPALEGDIEAWPEGEGRPGRRVETAPGGRFVIERLVPGEYRLYARAGALVGAIGAAISVREGGAIRGVEVPLVPGGVVEGLVKDAEGRSVAGAHIGVVRGVPPLPTATWTSRADGSFRIDGLAGGRWRLAARLPDGSAAAVVEVEVETGTTAIVTIVLRPG